jgi:hypothetical protein
MTSIHEISPDLFCLSVYAPAFDVATVNHFSCATRNRCCYAGLKGMFPELRRSRQTHRPRSSGGCLEPFESTSAALNDWLQPLRSSATRLHPHRQTRDVDDFSIRPRAA